jgi:hypothetical protein
MFSPTPLRATATAEPLGSAGPPVMSKPSVELSGVHAYSVTSAAPLITTMKATEVLVLPALDPGESYVEPAFVLVETAAGDDGGTITAIDLIQSGATRGGYGWTVKTLGQAVPLSHAAACEWAVSYAASRNIPIVYERNETIGRKRKRAGYAAALSAGAGGSVGAAASSAAK